MNYKKNIIISVVLIICFLFPTAFFAQGIKERMKERLPVIIELKANGIIGENFQGLLAFLTDNKPNQDIIDSENADREKIYSHIAKNTEGATIEFVGQKRAKQIAEHAEPGEFLQKEDGSWYQK
ncbi:MAG: YdbL family protein [Desulfobacteraceae bacterium]|nr:YdbL family protein [Desulfobacteraceae bacterium]